jgi:hypothetical protein
MKTSLKFAAFLLVALTACSKTQPLPGISDTTQSVSTQTNGDAVNRVASDQELLRQALILADSKGTLVAALTEAAQDSLVGIKMREALILGNAAKQHSTPPSKTPGKGMSGKPAPKGDVLDQTNRTLDKTNQEIDKAATAAEKARLAREKMDAILHGGKK